MKFLSPALVLFAPLLAGCLDTGENRRAGDPAQAMGVERNDVSNALAGGDGPRITLYSSRGGVWRSGDVESPRSLIASNEEMDFRWSAVPGTSGSPIVGYSYKIGDSEWTPYSSDVTEWKGALWDFPFAGTVSPFALRAIDDQELVTELNPTLLVFPGPRQHPESERYVLVVLDTDPAALQDAGVWPEDYTDIERSLIEYFLSGVTINIHDTRGFIPPSADMLSSASSVLWFHSADVFNFDSSVLSSWHETGEGWNLPASYVKSGGNFFLCGIQPVNALRWMEQFDAQEPTFVIQFPVVFEETLEDPALIPHWVAGELRIAEIQSTVTNFPDSPVIGLLESQATAGVNPYPDLEFDPLTLPDGQERGGFPYYDSGVRGRADAEVLYRDSKTGESLGVRRLSRSGGEGSVVVLGFHPWFLQKSQFRTMLQAVLEDFENAGLPDRELEAP